MGSLLVEWVLGCNSIHSRLVGVPHTPTSNRPRLDHRQDLASQVAPPGSQLVGHLFSRETAGSDDEVTVTISIARFAHTPRSVDHSRLLANEICSRCDLANIQQGLQNGILGIDVVPGHVLGRFHLGLGCLARRFRFLAGRFDFRFDVGFCFAFH